MKKATSLLLLCVIAFTAHAQSVGIGTNAPNASAQLDITSANKGLLIPRMNTAAINNIPNPAKGLMVLDTAKNQLVFNIGTPSARNWQSIAFNSGWSTTGNAGTNATNFIGTTDDNDVVIKRNNEQAGLINTSLQNTSWGAGALNPATTGNSNTAFGFGGLTSNTTGKNNTANGVAALYRNTTGNSNVANGHSALISNSDGFANVAVGSSALLLNSSGSYNVAVGTDALKATISSNNTGIGGNALLNNTAGFSNVSVGINSLINNTTGSNLVAIGDSAGFNNVTGSRNVFIGSKAGLNETGSNKLYISNSNANSSNALIYGEFDNKILAIGGRLGIGTSTPNTSAALDITSPNKGLLIPRMNTATITTIPTPAKGLMVLDTAKNQLVFNIGTPLAPNWQSIAFGGWSTSGNAGTDPASNFIGTTDDKDVVIKRNNVQAGIINDRLRNTSWGLNALNPATTGGFNAASGMFALSKNTSGEANAANGYYALVNNTTGSGNTASGYYSLTANNAGTNNSAFGTGSLLSLTTGMNNTATGVNAGADNITGSNNIFLGYEAGKHETASNRLYISNTDANANNALIYGEFDNKLLRLNGKLEIKTAAGNTGIDLASSDAYAEMRIIRNTLSGNDNDLYLGFGSPATSAVKLYSGGLNEVAIIKDNEMGIGKTPSTSNNESRLQVKQQGFQNGIGVEAQNSTNHWDFYATNTAASNFALYYNGNNKGIFDNISGAYTATSDRRLKKDITAQMPVLNNVLQLKAYQYHYLDNQPTDRFSNGFMAQDVQQLFPDAVVENTMKDGEKRLGINYQYFTVLAIKAVQEQQKEMEEMKVQMKMMMEEIEKLKKK